MYVDRDFPMKMDFSSELVKIGLAHVKHGLWGTVTSSTCKGVDESGLKVEKLDLRGERRIEWLEGQREKWKF
ncbi:hypothetical protein FCV25MIE_04265 [Fagus crenata]